MNRSFPHFFLMLLFAILTPFMVLAQRDIPSPQPGLWMIESTTTINDVNMQDALRAAQQQMLEELPPEYRAAVEAAWGTMADIHRDYQCISADDIAIITDPHAYLQRVNEEMPECRFEIVRTDGSMVRLNGRCDDAEGFSGDFDGELRILSAEHMRSVFVGKGRYLENVDLPGIELPEDGRVEMRMAETSHWISADCDALPVP
ncbi:MAG: DUF3617 domain-containing protein [Desulfuromonadales bacterium]|nr:DUF3617 domain-containing protein [Desulfuromonadales bacterium]